MLDMGFLDEIKNIFTFLPKERQTLMFSATMPKQIKLLAEQILNTPQSVTITKKERTNTDITQKFYVVADYERDDALLRLIDYKNPNKCIIFCRMKKEVDRLSSYMTSQGFKVAALHGDMEQKQREHTIRSFKQGLVEIFIATDVAARGLDVNDVSHVFNYHIPFDPQSYVHRIGRTGRAGQHGKAITLVSTDEFRELRRIQKEVGANMHLATIEVKNDFKDNEQDFSILEQMVRETEINQLAIDFIDSMEDMDYHEFVERVVSILLKEKKTSSTVIGYDKDSVNSMLDEYLDEQKVARQNGRHRKRR